MNRHLFYCASKTNQCPNCSKYIRRAIYNYHYENNCQDLNEDIASDEDQSTLNENNVQSKNDDDDDEALIPCEFCHEEIKFSSYEYHSVFENKILLIIIIIIIFIFRKLVHQIKDDRDQLLNCKFFLYILKIDFCLKFLDHDQLLIIVLQREKYSSISILIYENSTFFFVGCRY